MKARSLIVAFVALGCLAGAKVKVQGFGTKGRPAPTVRDLGRMRLVPARATRPLPERLPPVVRVTATDVFVQGTHKQTIEPLKERALWSVPRFEEGLSAAAVDSGGRVAFVVDPRTPYRVVKKLIFLANRQGFTKIDFVVRDQATGAPARLALREHGSVQPSRSISIGEAPSPPILGSLDPAIIDAVIKRRLADFQKCYDSQLKRQPTLQGEMVVNFLITSDGTVSESRIKSSTMGSLEVETCVAAGFKELVFPKPKGGGIVIVNYPLSFKVGP